MTKKDVVFVIVPGGAGESTSVRAQGHHTLHGPTPGASEPLRWRGPGPGEGWVGWPSFCRPEQVPDSVLPRVQDLREMQAHIPER